MRRQPHRSDLAEKIEYLDGEPPRVEFPPSYADTRRALEGVVIAMPSFAECEDAEDQIVGALVVGLEGPRTPEVAD